MRNTQKTESRFLHPTGALQLHHMFPTIQGEGPFAGVPAVFVRLAGCNLQCPACDTDYTSQRSIWNPLALVEQVAKLISKSKLVVITGGEPFRQNLTAFVMGLRFRDYQVQIETNGTFFLEPFPYDEVTIVCSPKTGRINGDLARQADCFKYVVQAGAVDPKDGLPISTMSQGAQWTVARPPADWQGQIYVQPLDEIDPALNALNTAAAVQSCKIFGHRLCLQTHKFANLE